MARVVYRTSLSGTALLFVAVTVAGCASGPAFEKIDSVPPDKGLIYIYRPPVMHGAMLTTQISVNDAKIIPLENGGYYPYFVSPGKVTITVILTGSQSISLDVKAGGTRYVKAGTVFMA